MVRSAVEKRDKGVCVNCGIDTRYLREAYRRIVAISTQVGRYNIEINQRIRKIREKAGWPDYCRDWWEADHVIPHSEGGPCTLDNMRTLCLRCHKKETAKLAARKAKERRQRLQPEFLL